ncbi:esterase-like activity of phytase family protein [Pararhizobium sp. BT-229]|uniref:esterase-like activity of phytase family protein n=1 Tax=Pararhizobium sp. BT-229 TaxID=2986923 RepID=UPI0021F79B09|nr:esterase-like activity of phytase family protein [Pararhizobium sp. BT-229]MCV9967527.1 esterase-like activity of phytase family protein [Pararhizobium sp. BT-229]
MPSAAVMLPVQETVPVKSRQIENFKIGSEQKLFGKLEFIGGIEMSSSNLLLGAISSIRFRPDRTSFVAIMDTGHWVEGKIERDGKGRLAGTSDLTVTSMIDFNGRSEQIKERMDSEGVALRDGEVLASYEGLHRVDTYPDPGFAQSRPLATLPILIAPKSLRDNRGLETIAVSPKDSALAGGVVVVSELSFDQAGHIYAAVLDGPRKGVFGVVQKRPFAVTDGAFLPNGDFLVLERRFSFAEGIGMQIRRIKGGDIKPGAAVDGEILLQADMGYQIDNMEGLDVVIQPDGEIRVIVVSDDNHSILERNLMLEFRLVE